MIRTYRLSGHYPIAPLSGEWLSCHDVTGLTTSTTWPENKLRAIPVYVPFPTRIDSLGIYIHGGTSSPEGGSKIMFYVFRGRGGKPLGTPIGSTGEAAWDVTTHTAVTATLTAPLVVAGEIWLAAVHNANTPGTYGAVSGTNAVKRYPSANVWGSSGANPPYTGLEMDHAYLLGSLPAWSGSTRTIVNRSPGLAMRKA